jgi:hypothetical protein
MMQSSGASMAAATITLIPLESMYRSCLMSADTGPPEPSTSANAAANSLLVRHVELTVEDEALTVGSDRGGHVPLLARFEVERAAACAVPDGLWYASERSTEGDSGDAGVASVLARRAG